MDNDTPMFLRRIRNIKLRDALAELYSTSKKFGIIEYVESRDGFAFKTYLLNKVYNNTKKLMREQKLSLFEKGLERVWFIRQEANLCPIEFWMNSDSHRDFESEKASIVLVGNGTIGEVRNNIHIELIDPVVKMIYKLINDLLEYRVAYYEMFEEEPCMS